MSIVRVTSSNYNLDKNTKDTIDNCINSTIFNSMHDSRNCSSTSVRNNNSINNIINRNFCGIDSNCSGSANIYDETEDDNTDRSISDNIEDNLNQSSSSRNNNGRYNINSGSIVSTLTNNNGVSQASSVSKRKRKKYDDHHTSLNTFNSKSLKIR